MPACFADHDGKFLEALKDLVGVCHGNCPYCPTKTSRVLWHLRPMGC
jgi:hypothetical protein